MSDAGFCWRARCAQKIDFKLGSNVMEKEHARGPDFKGILGWGRSNVQSDLYIRTSRMFHS